MKLLMGEMEGVNANGRIGLKTGARGVAATTPVQGERSEGEAARLSPRRSSLPRSRLIRELRL